MFAALRNGNASIQAHVNIEEYRKARIQNRKCFLDAKACFRKYCIANSNNVGVLEASLLVCFFVANHYAPSARICCVENGLIRAVHKR